MTCECDAAFGVARQQLGHEYGPRVSANRRSKVLLTDCEKIYFTSETSTPWKSHNTRTHTHAHTHEHTHLVQPPIPPMLIFSILAVESLDSVAEKNSET